MGLFDSTSTTSTKATETGQQSGKDSLNVNLDAYKSNVTNNVRLDNSLTQIDESDNSITNIDNSVEENDYSVTNVDSSISDDSITNIDNSIRDDSVTNIDNSVDEYDYSVTNTDNSVDEYDYSVANTDNSIDNSDNRVITYTTDFGAVDSSLDLAGDALTFAESIFTNSTAYVGDVFDDALSEISNANKTAEAQSLDTVLDFSKNVFYLLGVLAIAAAGAYAFKR